MAPREAPSGYPPPGVNGDTYIVGKKDTLSGIVAKLKNNHNKVVSISELMKWNNIKDQNIIKEGQSLRLTPPVDASKEMKDVWAKIEERRAKEALEREKEVVSATRILDGLDLSIKPSTPLEPSTPPSIEPVNIPRPEISTISIVSLLNAKGIDSKPAPGYTPESFFNEASGPRISTAFVRGIPKEYLPVIQEAVAYSINNGIGSDGGLNETIRRYFGSNIQSSNVQILAGGSRAIEFQIGEKKGVLRYNSNTGKWGIQNEAPTRST